MSVILKDTLLVIPREEVELGEVLGTAESVDELVDTREGVPVLLGDAVESSIVHTHAKGAVLLFDEEDGGTVWRGRWLDEALAEKVIQLLLEFVEFSNRETDDRSEGWVSGWICLDLHGIASIGWQTGGERRGKDIRVFFVNDVVNVEREGRDNWFVAIVVGIGSLFGDLD